MKAVKIAGGVLAAIVVALALLLVTGVPAGFLTSTIADRVARESGYRLTVQGPTRVGLWPSLNIAMNDVTLEMPTDQNTGSSLKIGSIKTNLTLASLWSGKPEITELVIDRPTLRIPLRRERQPATAANSSATNASPDVAASNQPAIRRITVTDGTMAFFNARDGVEDHVEGISARATIGADRQINLDGDASAGGYPLSFNVKASMPDPSQPRQTIPAELSLDAPGLLQAPLSSKVEVRRNGTIIMINGVSGTIGDRAFDGWASIDLASKPLVRLDLDFQRLDIAAAPTQTKPQDAAATAWSNNTIEIAGLNYVDAQVKLSASELNIGSAHFAPVAFEATLASGLLKGAVSNLGTYGGQANGTINIDVSKDTPAYAMRGDLTGVRALPLLSSMAGFDKLDGKLQAKIDVSSNGRNEQAIMSNLAGTVVANFQDGAIRGLNVAQMIRSLTSGTLSGWQDGQEKTTDLSQLSASFRIDNGQAKTTDLNLIGPLVKMTGNGTIDIGMQTLALRVEPKLVMTTEGQGRSSDPVGFGIPVAIDGPWAAPRIYPDVAGMLDNPDAAYARLKQIGAGLFAPGNSGGDGDASGGNGQSDSLGKLGNALGSLIQQGINSSKGRYGQTPNDPNQPSQGQPTQSQQMQNPEINNMLKQFLGR